ncbi:hypothetical protein [uncultured Bdellovibrio sp.]|uniref:c-type cytochrome n=1 Tax=Bdellovibrio sp. HCB-162 TaxID=3394234 RepID=UPI0025F68069|nr:hypothetical protein [uncultured Bdellovibrio sp.]
MKTYILAMFTFLLSISANAFAPDWSEGTLIPEGGRENIYQWSDADFLHYKNQGKIHTQIYPVTVTGMLPPYAPIKKLIDEDSNNPFKKWLQGILQGVSGYKTFNDVLKNLGLHPYPKQTDDGVYAVPYPNNIRPDELMGFGLIERNGAKGFTFSCAACHSSNLFGKTVLGMTNRFSRANEFFIKAKKVMAVSDPLIFQAYTGATTAERKLLEESMGNLRFVSLKQPIALGLDTSLAQVSLSLNRRSKDPYASYSEWYATFPRHDAILDNNPADSKPAVWWNLKYKNRWLSDGSVLSGNPIFTNIIWNEIGRGADLVKLEKWLDENSQVIEELTTAVFSIQAPLITDFIPAEKIDLGRAKLGEQVFNTNCAKCHGHYDKAWNVAGSEALPFKDQLKTVQVRYKEKTPVVDVGTDPYRRLGMKSLEQLNDLAISKKNGIVIKAQPGYVPPPLVGIWARWPYFHNNSIPNLCALLTPSERRPVAYYSGEANNPATDFDLECNGYPLGDKTPKAWMTRDHYFDTRKKGMSNAGHDDRIFIKDGKEILSKEDKKNLIVFLQTL